MSDILERLQGLIEMRNREKSEKADRRQTALGMGVDAYFKSKEAFDEAGEKQKQRDWEKAEAEREQERLDRQAQLDRESREKIAAYGLDMEDPQSFLEAYNAAVSGVLNAVGARKTYETDVMEAFRDPEMKDFMISQFAGLIGQSGLTPEQVEIAKRMFSEMFGAESEEAEEEESERRKGKRQAMMTPILPVSPTTIKRGAMTVEEARGVPVAPDAATPSATISLVNSLKDIESRLGPIKQTGIKSGNFENNLTTLQFLLQGLPAQMDRESYQKVETVLRPLRDARASNKEVEEAIAVLSLIVAAGR